MNSTIPVVGIIAGIIIPLAAFVWLYLEGKGKREAVIEIAKHVGDEATIKELLELFDERKKDPIDYRRGGVITLFTGAGVYVLGVVALGPVVDGIGMLIALIGVGTLVAGYLYPNTSQEITHAVERFEEK